MVAIQSISVATRKITSVDGQTKSCLATILDRMSEADWAREGTHSESGRYTMDTWLEIYAVHAHNHAAQIRRARAAAKG